MTVSEFLRMPPELVDRVLEYLSGKDLKNVALCSSAAFRAAAPILYRTIRLFYKEEDFRKEYWSGVKEKTRSKPIGLSLPADYVESVLSESSFALGYAKKVHIRRELPYADLEDRYAYIAEVSDETDAAIGSLIERFDNDQLESIKIDYETSAQNLTTIFEFQSNIRSLDLGDLSLRGKHFNLEELSLDPSIFHLPKLESLEISMIQDGALLPMLIILHQNSETLRRIRIGGRSHARRVRGEDWEPAEGPFDDFPVAFNKVEFPVLEQLSIICCPDDGGLREVWRNFAVFASVGVNFKHLRLSGFIDPYIFVNKLLPTPEAAGRLQSLQLVNCLDSLPRDGPVVDLPLLDSLSTLHMESCTNRAKSDFTAAFTSRHTLKRLWLSYDGEGSSKDDPDMSMLWEPSVSSLDQDRWPLLEELAIEFPERTDEALRSVDVWKKLPMLKSLKILRLLNCEDTPPNYCDPQAYANGIPTSETINAYAHQLYTWSAATYGQPPNLKLIIVDTVIGYKPDYKACPNAYAIHPPFPPPPPPLETIDVNGGDPPAAGTPPSLQIVEGIGYKLALDICKDIGISSYLLDASAWHQPDRNWEDEYTREDLCF